MTDTATLSPQKRAALSRKAREEARKAAEAARAQVLIDTYHAKLASGELVSCPVDGCLYFPDTPEEIAEHVASERHVFSPFGARVSATVPSTSPSAPAGEGKGSSRPQPPNAFTWTKHGDEWAVRVPVDAHKMGDTVTITNRKGESKDVKLGKHVETNDYLDVFLPFKEEKAPAKNWRWSKDDIGQWVVVGPSAKEGSVIEVTKKDGTTTKARVISNEGRNKWGDYAHLVEKVDDRPKAEALVAGMYREPGTDNIWKVQPSKSTGHLYALKLVELDEPKVMKTKTKTHDWEFDQGATRRIKLEWLVSKDEAAAWGRDTGTCMVCGATLEKKSSIEAGIGPICASKF